MNYYQKQIAKFTRENPAHVEAWMRELSGDRAMTGRGIIFAEGRP